MHLKTPNSKGKVTVIVNIVYALACTFILLSFTRYPYLILYHNITSRFALFNYSIYVLHASMLIYVLTVYLISVILLSRKKVKKSLVKRGTNLDLVYIATSIAVIILALGLMLELTLILTTLPAVEGEITAFVNQLPAICSSNVTCTVKQIVNFVNTKLKWSYNNPMSVLEIDNMLSHFDYTVIGILGFSRAHVILWQEWGSCGQHAIVTAYLLRELSYITRTAHFTDVDHAWAEVYLDGSWYIVDPWYIGLVHERQYQGSKHLVLTNVLASLWDFSGNHTVMCMYINGTVVDCTNEHGYK